MTLSFTNTAITYSNMSPTDVQVDVANVAISPAVSAVPEPAIRVFRVGWRMDSATISEVMREFSRRRLTKISPERRSEIARLAGKGNKGITRDPGPRMRDAATGRFVAVADAAVLQVAHAVVAKEAAQVDQVDPDAIV